MSIKNSILNAVITQYGIKAFEYGMAKSIQSNCDSYKDYPYFEKKTAEAEAAYITAQNHLKEILGIEE